MQSNQKLGFRDSDRLLSDDDAEQFAEKTTSQTGSNTYQDNSFSDGSFELSERMRKEKERNEPYQMFFYYPKYLHPEAVALIAQNLLNEWEEEELSQGATSEVVSDKGSQSKVKQDTTTSTLDEGN